MPPLLPLSAYTCQGFCHTVAPTGCACDVACTVLGDCCPDAIELCLDGLVPMPILMPTPTPVSPPVLLQFGVPAAGPEDDGTVIVPLLYKSNVTIVGFHFIFTGTAPESIAGGAMEAANFATAVSKTIMGAATEVVPILPSPTEYALLFNLQFNPAHIAPLTTTTMPPPLLFSSQAGGDGPVDSAGQAPLSGVNVASLGPSGAPMQFCLVDESVIHVASGAISSETFGDSDPCVDWGKVGMTGDEGEVPAAPTAPPQPQEEQPSSQGACLTKGRAGGPMRWLGLCALYAFDSGEENG